MLSIISSLCVKKNHHEEHEACVCEPTSPISCGNYLYASLQSVVKNLRESVGEKKGITKVVQICAIYG